MRVSIFPFFHVLGHVVPCLSVAEQLRERGAQVTFRGEGRYDHLARDAGFPLRPAFTFSEEHHRRHELSLTHWTEPVIEASVASELAAIDEDLPDVVIADFRPTVGLSARLRRIKVAAILGAELTTSYDYPDALPDVDSFPPKMLEATPPRLARLIISRSFHNAAKHLRRSYEQHGLAMPGEGSLLDAWSGDLDLLPDIPELMPIRPGAPPHLQFIGPALRAMPTTDGDLDSRLDAGRPLVYVSFGSSGLRRNDPLVERLAEAFAGRPEQVVMSTGGQPTSAVTAPDQILIVPMVDGSALAGRASLTICSGGKGTVYQSLAAGTPLLCLPRNQNQWYISERVARAGVGLMHSRLPAVSALRSMIASALEDPLLRRRASDLRTRIQALVGERRAGPLIERLAQPS